MIIPTLPWIEMALALPYGLSVGVGYFLALRLNARLYLESGSVWRPIVLMFARLIGAAILLGVLVAWGWAATLAGLAGFTLARPLVVRWLDRRDRQSVTGSSGAKAEGGA